MDFAETANNTVGVQFEPLRTPPTAQKPTPTCFFQILFPITRVSCDLVRNEFLNWYLFCNGEYASLDVIPDCWAMAGNLELGQLRGASQPPRQPKSQVNHGTDDQHLETDSSAANEVHCELLNRQHRTSNRMVRGKFDLDP